MTRSTNHSGADAPDVIPTVRAPSMYWLLPTESVAPRMIRDAPADKIFPFINDLRAQSAWSPFEKDPAMKRTHSGATQGNGAVYAWEGNRQVGQSGGPLG